MNRPIQCTCWNLHIEDVHNNNRSKNDLAQNIISRCHRLRLGNTLKQIERIRLPSFHLGLSLLWFLFGLQPSFFFSFWIFFFTLVVIFFLFLFLFSKKMKIAMLSSKKHAGILIVYLIYVEQYDHVFVRTANKTDDIDLENIDKCVHFIISIYPDAHIDFYGDELLNTNIQLSPLYRYIYTNADCKKTLPKIDNKFFFIFMIRSCNSIQKIV